MEMDLKIVKTLNLTSDESELYETLGNWVKKECPNGRVNLILKTKHSYLDRAISFNPNSSDYILGYVLDFYMNGSPIYLMADIEYQYKIEITNAFTMFCTISYPNGEYPPKEYILTPLYERDDVNEI